MPAYSPLREQRASEKAVPDYESQDYIPPHSVAYQQYLQHRPLTHGLYRGLTTAFIGVIVGLIGFSLHLLIDGVSDEKWKLTHGYAIQGDPVDAWLVATGYSLVFVLFSSLIVTFYRPSAAGSGIPELMGFLNGAMMPHIFNIKTLVVKFLSCVAAVGSGLPVGQEGPMIHMGSLVGAGVSQFKSDTLGFNFRFLRHFRNARERRNFVKAGAAAGVSSAFHAPIGGLLFVMEEVSTLWRLTLTWQTFFCCVLATFTTSLFSSAFTDFYYTGEFGMFTRKDYIMFPNNVKLCLSVMAFIPAIILGVTGGFFGALFITLHLQISNFRQFVLCKIHSPFRKNLVKVLECLLISVIWSSLSVWFPYVWPCTEVRNMNVTDPGFDATAKDEFVYVRFTLNHKVIGDMPCENSSESDDCDISVEQMNCVNSSFNELATLMWSTGADTISHLFRRHTYGMFHYHSLATLLLMHFIGAAWTSSASLASGLLIPMIVIGALYGRIFGKATIDIIGVQLPVTEGLYEWADPGVMALIGAASFFAGVSRSMISVAVIMVEMTNTVDFLMPIMVAVMVAKWTGDQLTLPLYLANLEKKHIPYLEDEPDIRIANKRLNLEMFSAKHVMSGPVITIRLHESVSFLARLLLETKHGGFPVVTIVENQEVLVGSITRNELYVLLRHPEIFADERGVNEQRSLCKIPFEVTNVDSISHPDAVHRTLSSYVTWPSYSPKFLCLDPYVNQSVVSVPLSYSLQRTYTMFRALGLRHLYVTDSLNRVVGVITRKDLVASTISKQLALFDQAVVASELSLNCHTCSDSS